MTCVYCLETRQLRDEQVLLRSEKLYICAPRGQLVEGYLVIAPYRCIGCLSQMPAAYFSGLARLAAVVADFYTRSYGTTHPTFYEQGRAGGGSTSDEAGGFPLHAHLCCLPLMMDLHRVLAREYVQKQLSGPHELAAVAGNEPYLYVESSDERFVYVARSADRRRKLARKRLKLTIASLAGVPERGYWRAYPGDRELEQLIKRWSGAWPS